MVTLGGGGDCVLLELDDEDVTGRSATTTGRQKDQQSKNRHTTKM
ncbi:MAG: hypothetical protein WDN06_11165 [Asticcacaulis sp.]